MYQRLNRIVLPLLLLSPVFYTAAEPALRPLEAEQIREMLVENTLVSAGLSEEDEAFWAVYYLADGRERGVAGNSRDQGQWRTQAGMLCSNWETWGSEEKCFRLFVDEAGGIVAFFAGKESFRALLEAGNSRGL